jgi:DNA polymerase-3 subunit delta'
VIPLHGHERLLDTLLRSVRAGTLPQSLLLEGPPGVGKQRLALELGRALLCPTPPVPCGACRHCRYAAELAHPDLVWVFPRPRLRDSDASIDDVRLDLAAATRERALAHGLYAAPPGTDLIFVTTIRFLVHQAALTPALASRKVFVIGDGDRMVHQEGSEYAANALLKLLEEPPADTRIIITTSAPGALLPTIRSRVVTVRVPRLGEGAVRAFVTNETVSRALDALELPAAAAERVTLAGGAPGTLLSSAMNRSVVSEAGRMLDAALSGRRADMLRLALAQGSFGARGGYSDLLDALTIALHERMRAATAAENASQALSASRAIELVEDAKLLADGNVNPQLITAKLLRDLSAQLA